MSDKDKPVMAHKRINIDVYNNVWKEISIIAIREDKSLKNLLNEIFINYLQEKGITL